MNMKETRVQMAVAGIFAISCLVFFQYYCSEHLFLKEQVASSASLSETIVGYMDKPAWLAVSLADMLSSWFIPIGGGAFLLTAVLLLEWWASVLVLRRFRVGEMAYLYALLPIILEWGTYCSPNYHLYSILSLTITLFLFYGYTLIRNKWISMTTGFALLFLIYSLAGSRLFTFVIMVLMYEGEIGEKRWIYWLALLTVGSALPELLKEKYMLTEEEAYQYPHAWLPGFFPAIMVAFLLVITQFKGVRHMSVNMMSVSVTSGLLVALLAISVYCYSVD